MCASRHVIHVTGATGAAGSSVLHHLAQLRPAHTTVRAQYRHEEQKAAIQRVHPEAEMVRLDFTDMDAVFAALRGVTTLFILTPYTVEMNVMARLLVDAAVAAKTRHIVHMGVSQPPRTLGAYLCWHLFVKTCIESTGLDWTHLRPNMFLDNLVEYGDVQTDHDGTLTFPLKPSLRMPWVSTEDIGAVAARILADPASYKGKIVPITSELSSVEAIAKTIGEVRGDSEKVVTPSPRDFYKSLVDKGGDPAYFDGFRVNVEEHNAMDDATGAPGAKEGLDAVRNIAKKEPMTVRKWAEANKDTWNRGGTKSGK